MNTPSPTHSADFAQDDTISRYFANVYKWMTLALGLTTAIAWFASSTPAIYNFLNIRPGLMFGLIIGELLLVIYLATRVTRMSYATAITIFMAYAALNGVTLSWIFQQYTSASLLQTFLVTTGMYAGMSVIGFRTKRDLSAMGSFLHMALIGIIIGMVVNFALASPMIDWVVTFGGIIVFAGLTAYDHQKIKQIAVSGGPKSLAIHSALMLYLDFVNLLILLLRVMGGRR